MRSVPAAANMEVFVSSSSFRLSFSNSVFPDGSVVRDLLNSFVQQQAVCSSSGDFYLVKNGRLCHLEDPLQSGSVYHLEPRLCGGKGGFGSMLRALGAQIEKTTNREACRDLSGRRLRDVNHEKEMADWLQQQASREAQKEQRRLERLQRKLSEPKHQFSDPEYQRQCHDLSERLEDSVLKGLQASCSQQLKVDDSEPPLKKRRKKEEAAACFWMGDMPSSDDDDDESSSEDEDESPSSSCGSAAVTMTTETSSSRSSLHQTSRPSEDLRPPETSEDQTTRPSETPEDQTTRPSEDLRPPETSEDQTTRPSEDLRPPETSEDQTNRPSEDLRPPETSEDQTSRPSEDLRPPETSEDQTSRPLEDLRPPETPEDQEVQVDLSSLSSLEAVQALGLDRLKQELMSRGLKCGGTLTERAARLFSVRGLSPDQIDPALLAKPTKTKRK